LAQGRFHCKDEGLSLPLLLAAAQRKTTPSGQGMGEEASCSPQCIRITKFKELFYSWDDKMFILDFSLFL